MTLAEAKGRKISLRLAFDNALVHNNILKGTDIYDAGNSGEIASEYIDLKLAIEETEKLVLR